jgi:hypothetical protein
MEKKDLQVEVPRLIEERMGKGMEICNEEGVDSAQTMMASACTAVEVFVG